MYCRGCFCSENNMKDVTTTPLNQYLFEGMEISVGTHEVDWRWLCWECEALLLKLVRFRRKIIRANTIIQHYLQQGLIVPPNLILQERCMKKYPDLAKTQRIEQSYYLPSENHEFDKVTIKVEFPYADDIVRNTEKADGERKYVDESRNSNNEQFLNTTNDFETEIPKLRSKKMCKLEDVEKEEKLIEHSNFVLPVQRKEKLKIEIPSNKKGSENKLDQNKIRVLSLTEDEQRKVIVEKLASKDLRRLPHRCTKCGQGFSFKPKFDNHMEAHDQMSGEFECSVCFLRFNCEKKFNKHKRGHKYQYQCVACNHVSPCKSHILHHYKRLHEGIVVEYKCKYCEMKFRKRITHKWHEKSHEGVKPQCETCGKTFTTSEVRDRHTFLVCNKDKITREFGCDKCDKKFFSPANVKIHQQSHLTGNKVCCEPCGIFFKSKIHLNQHLKRSHKHVDEETFRYACSKCPRRFHIPNLLHLHDLAKHSEKSFACEICEKLYNSKSTLVKHVREVHEGLKKGRDYICDICESGFRSKQILINHIRTHTGERPFMCEHCGSAFRQMGALMTHNKLVHLKIKRVVNRKK